MANDSKQTQTEQTRAVALKLFEVMEDIPALDALIAPDADLWAVGAGDLVRSRFVEMHANYMNRPEPLSRRTKLLGLVAEGDRASIEMEWELVWPDFSFLQNYHHVLTVRDGKIVAMRMYQYTPTSQNFFFPNGTEGFFK
jgi:ketosteroid isomerase-like protein